MKSGPGVKVPAEGISGFQVALLLLSIYVLAALAVDVLFELQPETSALLNQVDTAICVVFLGDFAVRLYRSENRLSFMRWGWVDLISSIPTVDFLRWGRVVRIVRILRVLRGVGSARILIRTLLRDRAKGTFGAVTVASATLLISSALAILVAEDTPESNIKNSGDALWWAATTITTVGYGDRYPVTAEGRIIGAILMVAGVGLFGTFTAFLATFFIGPDQAEEKDSQIAEELRFLRQRLESLEARLALTSVELPAQFGPQGQVDSPSEKKNKTH